MGGGGGGGEGSGRVKILIIGTGAFIVGRTPLFETERFVKLEVVQNDFIFISLFNLSSNLF